MMPYTKIPPTHSLSNPPPQFSLTKQGEQTIFPTEPMNTNKTVCMLRWYVDWDIQRCRSLFGSHWWIKTSDDRGILFLVQCKNIGSKLLLVCVCFSFFIVFFFIYYFLFCAKMLGLSFWFELVLHGGSVPPRGRGHLQGTHGGTRQKPSQGTTSRFLEQRRWPRESCPNQGALWGSLGAPGVAELSPAPWSRCHTHCAPSSPRSLLLQHLAWSQLFPPKPNGNSITQLC